MGASWRPLFSRGKLEPRSQESKEAKTVLELSPCRRGLGSGVWEPGDLPQEGDHCHHLMSFMHTATKIRVPRRDAMLLGALQPWAGQDTQLPAPRSPQPRTGDFVRLQMSL